MGIKVSNVAIFNVYNPPSNSLDKTCLSFITKFPNVIIRGGVEDTRLEAKAKDTKKIRGQGQEQPFRGQTLSRPRTGLLEASKDQGHSRKCSPKKKRFSKFFFGRSPIHWPTENF